MTRKLAGGLLLAVLVAAPAAQLMYNPSLLHWDHTQEDYDATTTYDLTVFHDATPPVAVYTYSIPKDRVTPGGTGSNGIPTWFVPFSKLPALPVGWSYVMNLKATGPEGTSDPSNMTPQTSRWNPCALPGSAGVKLPSLQVTTWPALKVGKSVVLTVSIRAPHDVQFVTLDLVGDSQPAWYYVTKVPPAVDTPDSFANAEVFWGPFVRQGRFQVTGQLIDSEGCQATLAAGTWVTVAP